MMVKIHPYRDAVSGCTNEFEHSPIKQTPEIVADELKCMESLFLSSFIQFILHLSILNRMCGTYVTTIRKGILKV